MITISSATQLCCRLSYATFNGWLSRFGVLQTITPDIEFVDGLPVLGDDLNIFQEALGRVNEYASEFGDEISITETNMFITPESHKPTPKTKRSDSRSFLGFNVP